MLSRLYRKTIRNKINRARNIESSAELAGFLSSGWKAIYQVWSLTDKHEIFNLTIDLPQVQVQHQLCRAFLSETPDQFEFPIAFRPSLRSNFAVLSSIVTINQQMMGEFGPGYDLQLLDLELSKSEEEYLNKDWNESIKSQITTPAKECSFTSEPPLAFNTEDVVLGPVWRRTIFSPNGKQFLVVQGKHRPKETDWWATWSRISFEECHCQHRKIHFKRSGSILIQCSPTASGMFCFHPFKPMRGIATSSGTSIWSYRGEGV